MILVTGASGFIGSHLLERLPRPEARALHRRDLETDASLFESLKAAECVVHLAALLRKSRPEEIRRVNVGLTQKLVEASKKAGVKRFVFVSTENVLREDIRDAYAETKREAEAIVRTFENHVTLRPCFVYGRGDTHGLGRLVGMAEKNALVPMFGGLKSLVQPVYIDDMVEYLLRAIRGNMRGEFIVAGSETVSLNDFVRSALAAKGLKKTLVPIPYAVYYAAAVLGEALPSAGWGLTQLRNIYGSRTYSIQETVRAFDYAPRPLETGLKEWLS